MANNTPNRVNQPLIFDAPNTKNQLDTVIFGTLVTTTPDVINQSHFLSHSSAVTVTNFQHGKTGQDLFILGNGNTTVSNNSNIKTSTGSNKVLSANKMYHFKFYNNVWYEVTN